MASFTAVQKLIIIAEVAKDQLTIGSTAMSRADPQDAVLGAAGWAARAIGPSGPGPAGAPAERPWGAGHTVLSNDWAAHWLGFASMKEGDRSCRVVGCSSRVPADACQERKAVKHEVCQALAQGSCRVLAAHPVPLGLCSPPAASQQ